MIKKVVLAGLILTVSLTFTGCAPGENMSAGMDMNHSTMQH